MMYIYEEENVCTMYIIKNMYMYEYVYVIKNVYKNAYLSLFMKDL